MDDARVAGHFRIAASSSKEARDIVVKPERLSTAEIEAKPCWKRIEPNLCRISVNPRRILTRILIDSYLHFCFLRIGFNYSLSPDVQNSAHTTCDEENQPRTPAPAYIFVPVYAVVFVGSVSLKLRVMLVPLTVASIVPLFAGDENVPVILLPLTE